MPPNGPSSETPLASESLPPVSAILSPEVLRSGLAHSGRLPDTIGSYKVLGLLGAGGMGVVYRAEQEQPRRQVALKVMKPGTVSPEHLQRFRREAEVLGRFQHDGIARIYEAGRIGEGAASQPYLVMELIIGRPLTVYAGAERLNVRQRVQLMIRICRAVQHAHQKAVIHGDLKPANILVDEAGQPKVLDFGLARVTDGDAPVTSAGNGTGHIIGTLAYLSPEQTAGDSRSADTLSDVYALGVILYELLAGRRPHDCKGRPSPAELRAITAKDPTPLGMLNQACRGDLAAIAAKAVERERSRRYQSVSELADDLELYLRDELVEARRGGFFYKAWKLARRKKAWAISSGVLFAMILAAIPLAAWAVIQRQRAELAEKEKVLLEAEGFVQKARAAARQGQWREAVLNYDKVLQAGHPDAAALRLKKCQALLAVNDIGRCRSEIEALAAAPNLQDSEGAVLLLQGDLLLGSADAKAEQLIRRARDKGLPPSADAYARALLAETTPEAIDRLQQALALDPDQPRARAILELLLIALGRLPEARIELSAHEALFPDDVNGKVLRALLAGLQRDQAKANEVLNGLRDSLGDKKVTALRALVKLLSEFGNTENPVDPDTGLPILTRHLAALAIEFPNLWNLGPGAGPNEVVAAHQSLLKSFPLPPLLRKSFVRVLTAVAKPGDFDANGGEILEELTQAVKVHPEGTLLYIRSQLLMGLAGQRFQEGKTDAFEEARVAALAAADVPGLLPVRQSALLTAALTDVYAYSLDKDPTRRRRIAENLRRMHDVEPNRVPYKPGLAVQMAATFEEYTVARHFLDNWQRQAPNDPDALFYRAFAESAAKSYGTAIEAADKLLQLPPRDTKESRKLREETEKLKKNAKERLQEQARRLAPAESDKR